MEWESEIKRLHKLYATIETCEDKYLCGFKYDKVNSALVITCTNLYSHYWENTFSFSDLKNMVRVTNMTSTVSVINSYTTEKSTQYG